MDFYFGDAHLNSEKCLGWTNRDNERSPKCLPIGGQSVWGTFGARDQRPVVLAVAGMDSKSLFHDITSANDAAGSIITVLAVSRELNFHRLLFNSVRFRRWTRFRNIKMHSLLRNSKYVLLLSLRAWSVSASLALALSLSLVICWP
jgi:hypothetical protein